MTSRLPTEYLTASTTNTAVGALVVLGGLYGYARKRSMPSLAAGVAAGGLLIYAGYEDTTRVGTQSRCSLCSAWHMVGLGVQVFGGARRLQCRQLDRAGYVRAVRPVHHAVYRSANCFSLRLGIVRACRDVVGTVRGDGVARDDHAQVHARWPGEPPGRRRHLRQLL